MPNFFGPLHLPYCTGPCNGGRKRCTCKTGQVPPARSPSAPQPFRIPQPRRADGSSPHWPATPIPTRPSWLHRLTTWWRARPLRQEYAGLRAEHAAIRQRIEALEGALQSPGLQPRVAAEAQAQAQLHRIGLRHVEQRRIQLRAQLLALGATP